MMDELKRIRREAVVAYLLSQYLPGGTEENRGKPPSGFPVSGPRFEPGNTEKECGVLTIRP
jgi:hypothetical protein